MEDIGVWKFDDASSYDLNKVYAFAKKMSPLEPFRKRRRATQRESDLPSSQDSQEASVVVTRSMDIQSVNNSMLSQNSTINGSVNAKRLVQTTLVPTSRSRGCRIVHTHASSSNNSGPGSCRIKLHDQTDVKLLYEVPKSFDALCQMAAHRLSIPRETIDFFTTEWQGDIIQIRCQQEFQIIMRDKSQHTKLLVIQKPTASVEVAAGNNAGKDVVTLDD